MKKTYIVPTAKTILLDAEESMAQIVSGSDKNLDTPTDEVSLKDELSNRRSIWGSTEW